ncbi:MAG: chemotaxis response regulator protein-glutamate methylesterase [Candidatus Nezhaarchaeales archaeon]
MRSASPSLESPSKKIKVLVTDDSALMRRLLSEILQEDPEIEVIAQAKNGREAVELTSKLRPNVVIMDIQMPVMNGLDAIKEIMEASPTPIIVFSALTKDDPELALTALEYGAVDVLAKPGGSISLNICDVKQELISKVKVAANINIARKLGKPKPSQEFLLSKKKSPKLYPQTIATIVTSTGGPSTLIEVLANMPLNPTLAILIIQHMPPLFTRKLAAKLNARSLYDVKEAEDGETIMGGRAYVAPGGHHMVVERAPSGILKIRLNRGPKVNFVRPSADVTLISLTSNFDGLMIVAILTGMGKDGCEGARAVKRAGGRVIAQDPETCVVEGMPQSVISAGLADSILPPKMIGLKILEFARSHNL